MRKATLLYAVAVSAALISCENPNGPETEKQPDPPPGTVILSEGFEGDLSAYRQIMYTDEQGMMSLSTLQPYSGKGSLTSDSNNTSIKRTIDPYLEDSIAGLQLYLMATGAAHTNFYAAMCKPGSSRDGMVTKFGMGIDKSDSLSCIYIDNLQNADEHRNFAPLALNKWYKCKIEYNFSDKTLSYFLDDVPIFSIPVPDPSTLQTFIVVRDNLGAQGPSGYYMDDVSVYKR